MATWKKCTIGELGQIITGKTPSTKNEAFWGGDVPFVTPKDIQQTKHIFKTERYITLNGLNAVRNIKLPPKAICVSCIGNIGYVGMTTQECISNQQINSIIVNDENDPDYVYYLIKGLWAYFKNYEGQSTTLSILNKTQFSQIEVSVPGVHAQRKIARVLSALDDKIEVNQKINDNLLQQLHSLFNYTFPYTIAENLPESWHVGTLNEAIVLHDSQRIPLSNSERAKMKKLYPYYGATAMMDYVDNYIFDGTYLLLGEDGTVMDALGHPVLQYVWGKFWVNNHAHVLTGKNGFTPEILFLLLKNLPIKSAVTGAVQPKISQKNLKSLQIVIPPKKELEKFSIQIAALFAQFRNNTKQITSLMNLRDLILPNLMTGKIKI